MIRQLLGVLCVMISLADACRAQPLPLYTLHAGQILRGQFRQERHLTGLATPIDSEGRFLLAPGKGLLWQGEKPFMMIVVITPTGILQRAGSGEAVRLPASRLPFLAHFYDTLAGALSGDWSALERDFAVVRQGDATRWTLLLTPLQSEDPSAMQLTSLVISGGVYADSVEIHRPNGDWERLVFRDQVRSAAPLSPEEESFFQSAGP